MINHVIFVPRSNCVQEGKKQTDERGKSILMFFLLRWEGNNAHICINLLLCRHSAILSSCSLLHWCIFCFLCLLLSILTGVLHLLAAHTAPCWLMIRRTSEAIVESCYISDPHSCPRLVGITKCMTHFGFLGFAYFSEFQDVMHFVQDSWIKLLFLITVFQKYLAVLTTISFKKYDLRMN